MIITYPFTLFDDAGTPLTAPTVTVTSILNKSNGAISGATATVHLSGGNASVDYDPELYGEAWITLAVSQTGSTITKFNAAPSIFASRDSSRVQSGISATGTVTVGNLPTDYVSSGDVTNITAGVVAGLASGVNLNLTQAIPTTNTAQTVGDALNAARAQGFGVWKISGTTLSLYAPDGVTVVRSFAYDSVTSPTQRV